MSAAFNPDRWLNWKPSNRRSNGPTKPTEPGSDGFEGTVWAHFGNLESRAEKIAFNLDRWLKWKPSDERSNGSTKPTGPGFEGFEGTVSAHFGNSESIVEKIAFAQTQWAEATLWNNDVRLLELDGVVTAGIWSDLDSKDIRDALKSAFPAYRRAIVMVQKFRPTKRCGMSRASRYL